MTDSRQVNNNDSEAKGTSNSEDGHQVQAAATATEGSPTPKFDPVPVAAESSSSSSSESEPESSTSKSSSGVKAATNSSSQSSPKQPRCSSCISTKRLRPTDLEKNMSLSALTDRPKKVRKMYRRGDLLYDRYLVLKKLGEGKFGRVVCAADLRTKTRIAMKIVTDPDDLDSARSEVSILNRLMYLDPEAKHLFVRMLAQFTFQRHFCIVFELLGLSIFDYLKKRDYEPYTLPQIQHIAYQLCYSIAFLHRNCIVHTDIKPENIVFVDRGEQELTNTHIKVIDFGTAVTEEEGFSGVVSTRHYRAPEVILRLGWSYPCDVWSIGCVLHETYTGRLLFPKTKHNVIHLAMFQVVLGPLPRDMKVNSGKEPYFVNDLLNICEEEMKQVEASCEPLMKPFKSKKQDRDLLALIRRMLTYQSLQRVTCETALQDPFFADLPQSLRLT